MTKTRRPRARPRPRPPAGAPRIDRQLLQHEQNRQYRALSSELWGACDACRRGDERYLEALADKAAYLHGVADDQLRREGVRVPGAWWSLLLGVALVAVVWLGVWIPSVEMGR